MRLPSRILLCAAAMVGTYASAQTARACSVRLDLLPPTPVPTSEVLDDAPANRIFITEPGFTIEEYWDGWPNEPPVFVEDPDVTRWIRAGREDDERTAYRLEDPQSHIGETVMSSACETQVSDCGFVLGAPDLEPPATPRVEGLRVTLYSREGGRGVSCPNVESMAFDVVVDDDRTPPEALRLVAFFGATDEETAAATEPGVVWQPWQDSEDAPSVEIHLGFGGDHSRDGAPFRQRAYCFSVAAMDLAGNLGPRSPIECIDTTDESDPRVSTESGCGCVGGGSTPGAALLLVPLLLVSRRRRS